MRCAVILFLALPCLLDHAVAEERAVTLLKSKR